ncbi:hypothetical protein AOQ72_04995 [Bradyrhizobium yuanmingense]|uniref:Uncharacterized protein n=1 Tax=Bradyrhizobium yuanmingense TaxID=108015 RepID=A0A0R3BQB7_9BRAD|nr:hypothetical protein [Bradyrhizobium yuanmingense]KRP85083.1 hypothetical protein AOQ72_04995 [Bradyrhizobium yuanmingense]
MHLVEDRIWSTIATNQPNPNTIAAKPSNPASLKQSGKIASGADTFPRRPQHWLAEFAHLVTDRLDNSWSGYMVTIMFSNVHGTRPTVLQAMKDDVARLYSILVTDVHRKPRTAPTDQLPVLLGALDLPVIKRRRMVGTQPSYNDGLHFHGLLLLPPTSRLKQDPTEYFRDKEGLYVRAEKPIERIHVQRLEQDPARATDYVLKTVRARRISYDDGVLVFPRARSELAH